MRLLIILAGIALFTGCAGSQPSFLSMTEEELHAYNSERPVRQQVYCFERRYSGSLFKRRHCESVQDILDANQRAMAQLFTMSPSTGYSVFGRGLD